jgi:hypothetical protein
MDAGTSTARLARTKHRHELRSLTYVTIDQANGGIVRNLSREGMGVQAVAAVPAFQEVRVRFELRYPKLRVEARGQVIWSTFSGQCGIRFLDLSPATGRQIQEWIFGNLLEGAALHADTAMFIAPRFKDAANAYSQADCVDDDGLIVSSMPLKVIELPRHPEQAFSRYTSELVSSEESAWLDWLTRPLSGLRLSWTIDILTMLAGLLLFALIFLSVTHESPTWPVALAGTAFVPAMYWGFFQMFGGCSLGARLARLVSGELEQEEEPAGTRFR